MPKYDYRCDNCGVFEVVQPITEEALKTCPTCGGKVARLISGNVNVILKGKGFAKNEAKRKEIMDKFNKQGKEAR
ncbi:MAG: zinc ribbon domain-containing protein [Clostridia bacterium]|nr:zinc ribbon domain-containing protein [Clostridia bacterium]